MIIRKIPCLGQVTAKTRVIVTVFALLFANKWTALADTKHQHLRGRRNEVFHPGAITSVDELRLIDQRNLMASHESFTPLPCNAVLKLASCIPWSSMNFTTSDKVTIDCGTCVTMDHGPEHSILVLEKGMDVHGKLVFPSGYRVRIETPFLHVQGELEMTSAKKPNGHPDVHIIMTGTDEELTQLEPHPHNGHGCGGVQSKCAMGKKPVVVAGGKLSIRGLPENCTTWTTLKNVASKGPADPTENGGTLTEPPAGCDRTPVMDTFTGGDAANWNSHWSPGGWEITDQNSHAAGDEYFVAKGRSASWQGPMKTMNTYMSCIAADVKYFITAKVRLTTVHNSTTSLCSQGDTSKCPRLTLFTEDRDILGEEENVRKWFGMGSGPKSGVVDGEWFPFFSTVAFTSEMIGTAETMDKRRLFFEAAEAGVDISIDDFKISMDGPDNGEATSTCTELLWNGDAEAMDTGSITYPFFPKGHDSSLSIEAEVGENGVNRYFAMRKRTVEWDTPAYDMNPSCITAGAAYEISGKVRVYSDNPVSYHYEIAFVYEDGSPTRYPWVVMCEEQSSDDGWVVCSGTYTFSVEDSTATRVQLYTKFASDSYIGDVDYDDLRVTFLNGPVTELIVADIVDNCWDSGAELLVTSNTLNYEDSSIVTIGQVSNNGDGTVSISLVESDVGVAGFSAEIDGPDYAVEVALLSRNIVFEGGDEIDPTTNSTVPHGGHLIVYHTPDVLQILEGIEVRKFGQQGILGRYSIHFHMCHSVEGSLVAKNLVRQAHQRCVVIHGTHNLTVSENVAYETHGHCYMLEDGGERDNVIKSNLAAKTLKVDRKIRDEETDEFPSSYWLTNPENTVIGNVAAGSEHSGYWYEMRTFVRGPSAASNKNVNPSVLPLKVFKDNIAHSNREHGLKTYPGAGYKPETQTHATFVNTKSYRNMGSGVFFHNSDNLALQGGLYADNRVQVDFDRSSKCKLSDGVVIGYSPEYRDVVKNTGTYSRHCPSQLAVVGVQMHTFWGGGTSHREAEVYDTEFHYFSEESTGCVNSTAMEVDYYENKGYFDIRSKISGLVFDTDDQSSRLSVCKAMNAGIDNVAIRDLDGSIMGTGVTGYIISDSTRLTTFTSPGTCVGIPGTCTRHCLDACFRTLALGVSSFTPNDLQLEITDTVTENSDVIYGAYDWPKDMDTGAVIMAEHTKSYRRRIFFATLPAGGHYSARFMLQGEPFWPTFVETQYEDVLDACGPDFSSFDLETETPNPSCDEELINNGNMEAGIAGWWAGSGGVVESDQSSSQQGKAIMNEDREASWVGLAQFLDSRCMTDGAMYSFSAKVKMEDSTWSCNPFVNIWETDCPKVVLKSRQGISDARNETWDIVGKIQHSWRVNDWNDVTGTIEVSAKQAVAESLMINFEGPPANQIMIVDDVSIKPYVETGPDCSSINDDFNDGEPHGWNAHFGPEFNVIGDDDDPDNRYFLTKRNANWQGPMKNFPVECFAPGEKYLITAKLRVSKTDGSFSKCHISHTDCVALTLYTEDTNPSGGENIKDWIPQGTGPSSMDDGEWISFRHVTTFSEDVLNTENLVYRRLYFSGPEAGVDIAMDDFKIEPYVPLPCVSESIFDDFEDGNPDSWDSHYSPLGYDVRSDGSNQENHYFVAFRSDNWQGPSKQLSMECIIPNEQYLITAKLRLSKSDGSLSNCHTSQTNCLEAWFFTEDLDLEGGGDNKRKYLNMGKGPLSMRDGEWVLYSHIYTFSDEMTNLDSLVNRRYYFNGPEAGVEVAVDDFSVVPYVTPPCLTTPMNDNFDDGYPQGWNSHYSPGGFSVREYDEGQPGNKYFIALGRSESWQGPMKPLAVDCIKAGVTYSITAKMKLNSINASFTGCNNCVGLTLYTEDEDPAGGPNKKTWTNRGNGPAIIAEDQWFTFSSTTDFLEEVTNTEHLVARRLFFNGPGAGVDMSLDDFKMEEVGPAGSRY